MRIKVFADAHGELLVPNGWEAAPAAATAPEAAADADAAGATGAAAEPSADAASADADAPTRRPLDRLKSLFLERRENPIRAENNPLYSLHAMFARDALRLEAVVVSALADAWPSTSSAAAGARGKQLNPRVFATVRRLYLACSGGAR